MSNPVRVRLPRRRGEVPPGLALTRSQWRCIKFQGHAPPGMLFVCRACGRTAQTKLGFGDASCNSNAVLAFEKGAARKYRCAPMDDVQTWVFRVQAHAWLSRNPSSGVSKTHE